MSDQDSLSKTYLSLRTQLMRVVARIVPPKEIEDIVQETYVRVCQIDKKDSIRTPRAFLMKTAQNLAFDYVKRAETRLTSSIEEDPVRGFGEGYSPSDEPFEHLASNDEFSYFCEAVRRLPVKCRRTFILKKVYGFAQKEIAEELNISESTVEKHVALGIKRSTQYMLRHSGSNKHNVRSVRADMPKRKCNL